MTATIRKVFSILTVGSALFVSACSEPPTDTSVSTARPVKSMVVAEPQGKGIRHFPGRVDSANKAQLSFRVNGKLDQLFVTVGERVKQGQLLAQLDQADFDMPKSTMLIRIMRMNPTGITLARPAWAGRR